MKCPVDGNELESHGLQSVTIEECGQCKGLWFEKGELRVVKDEMDPNARWIDVDLWSDHDAFEVAWSKRKCPNCGKNMATISYGEPGVNIDYCVDEHGIWLDKGELEAIMQSLEKEINTKDVSGYVKATLEEAVEVVTGDEGVASEWKDLRTVARLLQYRILSGNEKLQETLVSLQITQPFH